MGAIADLSKWQGDIDFKKLSEQVDFVIIKVQSGYTKPDPNYAQYVSGCKANGIPWGSYSYGKYVSINDAISEADSMYEKMDKGSQFAVIDVEEVTTKNPADLIRATQAFIDRLKSHGVQKVGLYSGENFYVQQKLSQVKADFLWLANYGKNDGQPHDKPVCDLWQYTSVGKLDGITCNVDLNQLTGTKPLEYFVGSPKNIFFITGGFFSGDDLCKVFKYITDWNWWYEPSRRDDGSLMFKVGGLPQGRTAAIDFENFLKSNGYWYQIQ